MLQKLRKTPLFLLLRRSQIVVRLIRPIYDNKLARNWWKEGRPTPPPHIVKMSTLLYWADRIDATSFIETGSYLGDTIRHMQGRFNRIFSIEIAGFFANPLNKEFKGDPSIEIVIGDSGAVLPSIVEALSEPTLFWLDAHHSGGDTEGFGYVPIYIEIDAISKGMNTSHVIVIDDMIDFKGVDGYPTVEELEAYLNNLGYETSNNNNMMQALKNT